MTDQEWAAISLLLAKGWKGQFGPGEDRAYRTLLDGYEPEQIVTALRTLLAKGTPFVPAAAEIVQAVTRDADRPTFAEAFTLIFSRGGVLSARVTGQFESEAAMLSARDRAALARAWDTHPLIGSFVQSYGTGRLRMLQVDHEELAGVVRRELEEAWDRFVEVNEHRDAAALASGRRRVLDRGLQRFDPPAALGVGIPDGVSTEGGSDGSDD